MQREKVIELARKSGGMFLEQGTPGVTAVHKLWEFWPDGLQEFARLVELETLERAARVCDGLKEKYSKMADDDSDVTNGYVLTSRYWSHVSALSCAGFDIRNLKETNDKE